MRRRTPRHGAQTATPFFRHDGAASRRARSTAYPAGTRWRGRTPGSRGRPRGGTALRAQIDARTNSAILTRSVTARAIGQRHARRMAGNRSRSTCSANLISPNRPATIAVTAGIRKTMPTNSPSVATMARTRREQRAAHARRSDRPSSRLHRRRRARRSVDAQADRNNDKQKTTASPMALRRTARNGGDSISRTAPWSRHRAFRLSTGKRSDRIGPARTRSDARPATPRRFTPRPGRAWCPSLSHPRPMPRLSPAHFSQPPPPRGGAAFGATAASGRCVSSSSSALVRPVSPRARRIMARRRRCVVIEAADRVGGRFATDTRAFGVPFDHGAHRMDGAKRIDPVAELATVPARRLSGAPGQRLRIGRRFAREGEMEDPLAAWCAASRTIGDSGAPHLPMSPVRRYCRRSPRPRAVRVALGRFAASKISTRFPPTTSPRQSSAITMHSAARAWERSLRSSPTACRCSSTAVTLINTWGRTNLDVRTTKGWWRASAVIVTASTGVLSAGKIQFDPALPRRYLDAIAKLPLGSYDRIALELEGNPLGSRSDELMFEKASGNQTRCPAGCCRRRSR